MKLIIYWALALHGTNPMVVEVSKSKLLWREDYI